METTTLSLHDALPISTEPKFRGTDTSEVPKARLRYRASGLPPNRLMEICCRSSVRASTFDSSITASIRPRSEEHPSELQSRPHLVCRLLPGNDNHSSC